MVTAEQIKHGVSQYIDTQILPKLDGGKRIGAAVYVSLLLQNGETKLHQLLQHPALKMLELQNPDGLIDIDKVYTAISQAVPQTGKLDLEVPLIGRFSFTRQDIDRVISLIRNS